MIRPAPSDALLNHDGRLLMQRHTTRVTTALLAFALGAGAANLFPARRRAVTETVTPAPTADAACPVASAAMVTVADTVADDAKGATPRVKQTLVTTFPTLGTVRVRAVENFGEQMRIEVLDVGTDTDKVLASFPAPVEGPPDADAKLANPFQRFRILRPAGLPGPLIFAVATSPGGSGHGFGAMLIGEVGGHVRVLTEKPLWTDNQGGVYVGDLGGGRGVGAAVWWPADDGACHYCPQTFEVALYPFDSRRKRFVKGCVLRSKGMYGGHGEGALKELGLNYTDLLQDMPDVSDYHWL
jgi:hypothetical protein